MSKFWMAAVIGLAGCQDHGRPGDGVQDGKHPIVLRERLEDTVTVNPFFNPQEIRAARGRLWLLDSGNKRLVQLNRELEIVRSFGGEGEGPGELLFSLYLEAFDDELWVYDVGNARLSVFGVTDGFRRVIKSPFWSSDFVPLSDGSVVLAQPSGGKIAVKLYPDGSTEPFGPAEAEDAPEAGPLGKSSFATRLPSGRLALVDGDRGSLWIVDEEGAVQDEIPLPIDVVDRLREKRRAWHNHMASQGRATSTTFTKGAYRLRSSELLVLIPLPDVWAVWIDVDTREVRTLHIPDGVPKGSPLERAKSVALIGDELTVLHGDGLTTYGWPFD